MKHVRKWLPVPTYDLPGMEGWLEEMAGKGLYLERLKSWTARFRQGEPRSRRFRLQPCCGREREFLLQKPPEDLVELFASFGWQCEGWASSSLVLFSTDDPEAPELYTDPESFGWAMKKLIRRQWLGAAMILLWAGWLLRDHLATLFTTPAVIAMDLVLDFERLAPLYLAMAVVIGGTVLRTLYRTIRFTWLRRRLAQGELPPVQKRTYPQLRQFLLTLFLVVFLVGYFFFFNWVNSWRERPLPENPAEWDFPHITLSETVPAGTELRENARQTVTLPSQPGQIVFFYDRAYTSWSAPEQYYVTQSGLARLPGEISRQVQLVQDYTKTRAPFLAEWVYAGKVQEWRQRLNALVSEYGAEETISYPGLDQLTRFSYQYWGEDWSRACYVGRLGSQVFVLHLRGPDLETPLDLLTERLAAEAA